MSSRVCFTTFIYGYNYQSYLPFLIYSCKKAYPEYDIHLFLNDILIDEIRKVLRSLNTDGVAVHEKWLAGEGKMTPLKAQCLRWVVWDDSFWEYDYIYTVDVDMFYLREPIPIHGQHIQHMSVTGSCYDNILRKHDRHPYNLRSFLGRIKRAGFKNLAGYFFNDRIVYRVTGLHFVEVKGYYSKLTKDIRQKFMKDIMSGDFVKYEMLANDEALLYYILNYSDLTPERLPVNTNGIDALDFNNPLALEFRPHHGIHFGIFRGDYSTRYSKILDSNTYNYYVDIMRHDILQDPLFWMLYENSSEFIKFTFDKFLSYYHLQKLVECFYIIDSFS